MLIKFTLKKHKKENVAVVIFIDHSDRQKKKKKVHTSASLPFLQSIYVLDFLKLLSM